MNIRLAFTFGLLFISGCRDAAVLEGEENTSPRTHLERLIRKSGEVRFYAWNGTQHNQSAYFHMSFLKDNNVELEIFGYNVDFVSGSYSFVDDATIKITFNRYDAPPDTELGYTNDWPLLRLREEGGDLLISRDDGKPAWHINWPLYPEIVDDVWPARTLTENTEQDGTGQPATRSESDSGGSEKPQPEAEGRSL